MFRWRLSSLLGVLGLLIPSVSLACLWDRDTLMMERQRFPNTLELITGKFLRHSKEFYQWRIQDRLEKLKTDPDNLAYYDDLAVAYDKTDQDALAIETILLKDRKKPGLYETEANLGTFYIHSGQLERGLEHIHRAIEINPNAHFGREKYQAILVEYVLEHRRDGILPLPLSGAFLTFLEKKLNHKPVPLTERQEAIEGILGIMKFGKHDSPLLLELLADLLTQGGFDERTQDAKQLAARAYLRAAYETHDPASKEAYRVLASQALSMQLGNSISESQMSLTELEQEFQLELTDAQKWYDGVKQNELKWIREGKDADDEFRQAYYAEPDIHVSSADRFLAYAISNWAIVLAGMIGAGFLVFVLVRRVRGRRLVSLRLPGRSADFPARPDDRS